MAASWGSIRIGSNMLPLVLDRESRDAGWPVGLSRRFTPELASKSHIVQKFSIDGRGRGGRQYLRTLAGAACIVFQKGFEFLNPSNTLAAQGPTWIRSLSCSFQSAKGYHCPQGRAAECDGRHSLPNPSVLIFNRFLAVHFGSHCCPRAYWHQAMSTRWSRRLDDALPVSVAAGDGSGSWGYCGILSLDISPFSG